MEGIFQITESVVVFRMILLMKLAFTLALYDLQRIEYSLHDFEWLLHELMSAELLVETVERAYSRRTVYIFLQLPMHILSM